MGRHSQTPKSGSDETVADTDTDALDADVDTPERTAKADAFWEKVQVEPIEIALSKGVGLTLRAYRMSDAVDLDDDTDADEPDETSDDTDNRDTVDNRDNGDDDDLDAEDDDDSEDDDSDDDDGEDEEEKTVVEEIPVLLSHRDKLLLFETPESLVKFVKSDAPHALLAIEEWDQLVEGIKPEYVVATEEDTYELDLVVKNLRGGHDTWEPELLISAGELARDLGHALRIPSVISTLGEDSPLDKLDNVMRTVSEGGIFAKFARRKIRKIGEQQASLAWRGIVSKIGESADWRK